MRALLEAHLRFCRSLTPLCHAYALDAERLAGPDVTFFSARQDAVVLGRAVLEHLVGFARAKGYERVSSETGTMAGFAPARRLYERAGFVPCGPFGAYKASPDNTFMTLALAPSP